ncbi:MAG: hypothetical protein M1834_007960 [Cirrosporium novae-zelandiae]|nr:MAG: hypothetical protein M1834_007960 [Cirrosporium novae-zelandiae]
MAHKEDQQDGVNGEGWISDDSSFYGDSSTQATLESEASSFHPMTYWSKCYLSVSALAAEQAAQKSKSSTKKIPLYNEYEGNLSCRQLSETVPAFLERLSPSHTLTRDLRDPWIRIANPHTSWRPTSENWAGFKSTAESILSSLSEKIREHTRQYGSRKTILNRKLSLERKETEEALRKAAADAGCTTGKWMLFLALEQVDEAWESIATATAENELGIAAKVAPQGETDDGRAPRLICIYTKDFSDMDDVKRVLENLVELKLAGKRRWIYYKCGKFISPSPG